MVQGQKITDGLGLNDFIKLMVRHNSPEHVEFWHAIYSYTHKTD